MHVTPQRFASSRDVAALTHFNPNNPFFRALRQTSVHVPDCGRSGSQLMFAKC
jgi:hypothetical protein